MKKIYPIKTCLLCALSIFVFACSSDDEDDNGHHANNSFVARTYVYQWTLQNSTTDFQHQLRFSTDSTFTFNTIKVETGESTTGGPKEGVYKKETDGTIVFLGSSFKTNVKGQRVTLHKGYFPTEDEKVLKISRTLDFSTGNSRTDWIDYELQ